MWGKYYNHFYGFITVVAFLLAPLFYWFPKDTETSKNEYNDTSKLQKQELKNVDRDLAKALLSSLNELESNLVVLDSMSALYNNRVDQKYSAKLDYSKSISFFTRYFDRVFPLTYGETENLIPSLSALQSATPSLNSVSTKNDIIQFNENSDLSMDDIRLLTGFYIFYLDIITQEYLPTEFTHTYDKHNQINTEKNDVLIMNTFVLDGIPVKNYEIVLGLLD